MEKTVVKALAVLEVLAAASEPRGVTEIAAAVDLTKANVHRLLRTLLERGYVVQRESDARYALSLKLWELGASSVHQLDLLDVARAAVRALCAEAGESAQLAVPEGTSMVYVDKADSPHPLRATTQIGGRVPMHCVSSGKAVLAFSEAHRRRLAHPLSRYTDKTITEPASLALELERIRADGYAVNRGEWRAGIWGIAAPIYDAHGDVVAAIDVWGPEERLGGAACADLAQRVQQAAAEISRKLGHGVAFAAQRSNGVTGR